MRGAATDILATINAAVPSSALQLKFTRPAAFEDDQLIEG